MARSMGLQSSTSRPAEPDALDLLLRWGRALHDVERAFEPQLTYDEAQEHENAMAMRLVTHKRCF